MIKDCMKKVTTINLHQTIKIDSMLEIKAYYAGHVLGAAMVLVKVGSQSFVYTVSFTMFFLSLCFYYAHFRETTIWPRIDIWGK